MGVFGQTSGQLGSSSVFGSTFNSTQNPFGPATSPSFPTQSSVFGGSSTRVFGASNQSFMFGKASGPFVSSSGSTTFPSFQTQGSIFRESSTGVFGASSSSPASSPSLMFGQTSGSLGSSSVFASSSCNPVASNTVESSTLSGLPAQSSSFGGTSTGVFGRTPSSLMSSPSTFSFGIASTAAAGSSAALGAASSTSKNAFAFKPFQSAPAFASETAELNFSQTSTGFLGATRPVNPFATSSSALSTSISSAMPIYGGKSHEELRGEHHELKSGGKNNSESNHSIGVRSTFTSERPTFSFSSPTNPVTSTCPPFTASTLPTSSSTSIPVAPVIATPAVSTNMNTSIFRTPCFSNPAPLPNSGLFGTETQISNASESAPSIFKQGLFGSLGSWTSSTDNSSLNSKPLTLLGVWSNHTSGLTPDAPVKQPPSTFGRNLFNVNNAFVQPAIAQVPSMGTGLGQTIPAQSPVTVPTFSTGGNVGFTVSSDLDQPSLSQPSLLIDKATDSIVAVKDPFGPQSAASWPPICHLDGPSIIQHGISNMPVLEKPSTTRISSFLTARHSSLRPLTVHVRKYRPKNGAPKVAFFDLTEGTHSTRKEYRLPIPRENPRSVFCTSMELDHVTATKSEAPPSHDSSSLLYEDGEPLHVPDALKICIPSNSSLLYYCFCMYTINKTDGENAETDQVIDMKLLMPKLQRSDYYTKPGIHDVMRKESTEPGFCSHVKDFVVGTRGKTGKEYRSKKMVDKFTEKLRKAAEKQGAEFGSFDPVKGEWKFRV
ncbi:hypothetical protein Cgig2_001269 [Carnegiea gigantea]|uniref:Peptidase S59 domain-containing protein n=1 Tax=Carnegiea gigantea TaxID=171969 RepID=A0A9Q1GSI7_9CARY|nr:hypothetical protein Cgig2_001269 [Carnegiea gigantea]